MGVQGLTRLLENHHRVYMETRFRRSRLLIDGCNLIYLLYFDSGLDQNHGGEYAAFESLIESFIRALRTCDISPYVVLDGASNISDKKVETQARRTEDRVQRASQAAVSGRSMQILPPLASLVLRQTLARLQVPVAQCFEESDHEIAALASEWKCPVLSNDSDFFIFDLPAGLLPISHFHWKEVNRTGSQNFISCRRFYTSSFCSFFGVQLQLLPSFAALAGNDYVKLTEINWTQFAPADQERPSRLEGLLRWLRDFQRPQDALEAALGLLGDLSPETRRDYLQKLYQGMEDYELRPSPLSRFFLHGVPPEFSALEEVDLVPHWMLLPLTQARLTSEVLDVLRLRTMKGLSLAVELQDLPSSNRTSSSIRQVMYGLLLGNQEPLQVMEVDRVGSEVYSIPVDPMFSGIIKQMDLSTLNQVRLLFKLKFCSSESHTQMFLRGLYEHHLFQEDHSDRLQVLLEVLGVTGDSLSLLPPQLKLPVAVTCYWMQRAKPKPDQRLLKALLLSISTGTMTGPRTGLQRDGSNCTLKLDISTLYSLNQWQMCLKSSIWLNQLLGFPLQEPQISRFSSDRKSSIRCLFTFMYKHVCKQRVVDMFVGCQSGRNRSQQTGQTLNWRSGGPPQTPSVAVMEAVTHFLFVFLSRLYEGTLVHQLVHRIRTGGKLKSLLKTDRTSRDLYRIMLSMVQQFQAQQVDSEDRLKASTRRQVRPPLNELTASLQQLFLQPPDPEEQTEAHIDMQTLQQLQLEEQLSIRTRFKTKDRSNRCNKPELSRKNECRGGGVF
ncbi:protein asteroid homolog 1 [Austrofundulus limnaeus]|uniref:Protein asteroid homolog 1 n=1 Tax=Austrofundulus limnaeus TaxID=52670 RepID=A0A2I4D092_AUSLI|nr:PREDICTED: protein asteroid homolog 1-like [Austrofundulus limnaeus]